MSTFPSHDVRKPHTSSATTTTAVLQSSASGTNNSRSPYLVTALARQTHPAIDLPSQRKTSYSQRLRGIVHRRDRDAWLC